MTALRTRLTKLEVQSGAELSERARAWLGLRGPLSAEEEAAEPLGGASALDLSGCSLELREWLEAVF